MQRLIQFFKDWTLPVALVVGVACYPIAEYVNWISPWLIFCMLLLTFCKVSLRDMHLSPSHAWLLAIEILGSIVAYMIVAPFDQVIAQGVIVCFICPTATAAAVITNKLHGNIAYVMSYTLLCNLAVSIVVPIVFPLISPFGNQFTFWRAFWIIIRKIFPLLITPFLLALFMRRFTPRVHAKLTSISDLAFYLWALALVVAIAKTVQSLLDNPVEASTLLGLCIVSAVACAVQFVAGRRIGKRYGDAISSGQSLGQKNTILAIWMSNTYMNPVSALAPGAYIIWQNIFNAWQLYKARKQDVRLKNS